MQVIGPLLRKQVMDNARLEARPRLWLEGGVLGGPGPQSSGTPG